MAKKKRDKGYISLFLENPVYFEAMEKWIAKHGYFSRSYAIKKLLVEAIDDPALNRYWDNVSHAQRMGFRSSKPGEK